MKVTVYEKVDEQIETLPPGSTRALRLFLACVAQPGLVQRFVGSRPLLHKSPLQNIGECSIADICGILNRRNNQVIAEEHDLGTFIAVSSTVT